MLKLRIIILIVACQLAACNTLPHRSADNPSVDNDTRIVSVIQSRNNLAEQQSSLEIADISDPPIIIQREHDDVWARIRAKMALPKYSTQASVKAKVAWYARHQDYLDRVSERARPYIYHIVEELEKRNLPVELALLPIVESAYHPFAYSRSHASGIWQFIPGTGKNYGLKQNWWYDGRRDIVAATDAALRYLEKLNKEFNGDWLHALAAYNTGERNVARAITRNKKAGKPTDFWSLRLPRETRGYVPSLLAVAELLANPEQYNVSWKKIENKPYFVQIDVLDQLDLATAAKLAQISMDDMYTLNPGFNRWATDPEGPHRLLVPVDNSASFELELHKLSKSERLTWKRHVIKRGENLGFIAQKYHTNVDTLKQTNNIHNNLIREGQSLLIPSSSQPSNHYTLSLDSRRYRGLKKSGDGENHIYTVQRGDTLWDIGRQYGVSIQQLCSWNGMNSRSILRPGKKLNLWLANKNSKASEKLAVAYNSSNAGLINYTVKKGDSLWLIARRHNVSVKQLIGWNRITKNKHLKPGQKIIIQNDKSNMTGV